MIPRSVQFLRRPFRGAACTAGLLLVAACGQAADDHTLAEGRYAYSAVHPAPGAGDSVRLHGVLVITHADADSIAGHFEVPQLHPALELGGWTADGYEVLVNPTYFGILTHRIRPGPAGEVQCTGEYTWVASGGVERSVPARCTVSEETDVRPAMPPTGAQEPVVREIDADSVPNPSTRPDTARDDG